MSHKPSKAYYVEGVHRFWIDEGYGGRLIAYYFIPETKAAWKYWLENKPVIEMTENNGPSARKEA